jgi:hypothetical protein
MALVLVIGIKKSLNKYYNYYDTEMFLIQILKAIYL